MEPNLPLLLSSFLILSCNALSDDGQPYIIHMDVSAMPAPFATHESWYKSVLSSLPSPPGATLPAHLYTYSNVMHGFSAVLSSSQLQQLEQTRGHLTAIPDSFAQLHTTRTPKFLGLTDYAGLWPASDFGEDVIIGILDTGVWPECESFNDGGMPPVPARWKGKCETGTKFNSSMCNRKLIGARSFSKGLKHLVRNISTTRDYDSPRDYFGHGTHVSSTAAGSRSPGASYFGYARGTATGIAPKAFLAMYKVLFFNDTFKSAATDVLAGMDQAIADGVDVMSLSLGFPPTPYHRDVIAMGAFAAMERGIFVSCSAGNNGSRPYSIINGAPWITSVGAGTIDRDYMATITFGDGLKSIQGRSIFPKSIQISNVSLYFGHGNPKKESCSSLSLERRKVARKVVFCSANINGTIRDQLAELRRQFAELQRVAPLGAILATNLSEYLQPGNFFMPLVTVSSSPEGVAIRKYVTEAQAPTVSIKFGETKLGRKPAPQVAFFSSRGPSRISPGILKPDLLAPGVDVLAAWVPNRVVTQVGGKDLFADYILASGTSMASPHVIGVAAMLRSLHKEWGTAAIRSAMMTTAELTDNTGGPILDMFDGTAATPLAFGAGHINPDQAMDPGLVYDMHLEDYIDFLCALDYSRLQIGMITRRHDHKCTRANLDLNYPSFMMIVNGTNSTTSSSTFKRILTNVGDYPTSYHAVVKAPKGMKVVVMPQVLHFVGKHSKQEFSVTVKIDLEDKFSGVGFDFGIFGFLSWHEVGGKHVVRSPIVSTFAL